MVSNKTNRAVLSSLEKGRIPLYALILSLAIQASIGLYGLGTLEDAPVHALMLTIILEQGPWPENYEPFAPVDFTYPPLFHYLSSIFYWAGLDELQAIKAATLLVFTLIPLAMYLAAKPFGKIAAGTSAILSLVPSNFTLVYAYGEAPELLGMVLFLLFLHFHLEGKYTACGIFVGLALLSHPFIGPLTAVFALILMLIRKDTRANFIAGASTILIFLPWLPKYFMIVENAIFNRWHNVVNYGIDPGIIGITSFLNFLLQINPFVILLAFAGIWKIGTARLIFSRNLNPDSLRHRDYKREQYVAVLLVFFVPLAFTIYHFPMFQQKMFDVLAAPAVILASIGLSSLFAYLIARKKFQDQVHFLAIFAILAAVFVISIIYGPWATLSHFQAKNPKLDPGLAEASEFLAYHDQERSGIIVAYESRLLGKSELMVGQISGKLPIDAFISDLEFYSPQYVNRLKDRKKAIDGDLGTARNLGVKYMFINASANAACPRIVYQRNSTLICKLS